MLRITDLVNGRARIYIQAAWPPESVLLIKVLCSISQDLQMHNTGQIVARNPRMK